MMNEEGKVQEERAVQVNDFAVDTQKEGRKRTPRRLKVLLGLSLVVTGFAALGCLWSLPWMIKAREWEEAGAVAFAGRILFVFTILISFAGLICIAKDLHAGRMFSGTLARCVLLLGVIYNGGICMDPQTFRLSFVRVRDLIQRCVCTDRRNHSASGTLASRIGKSDPRGSKDAKRTGGNIVGGAVMAIILRLDRVMADRKMSLNELSDRVGISNVNLSNLKTGKVKSRAVLHTGRHLRRAGLPARRYIRI